MTKGTRFFLVGAVVVVTAGLATGLVAFYNGSLTIGSSSQPDKSKGFATSPMSCMSHKHY